MKKKSTLFLYNDELDLNSLIRVILNAKAKITIITLISFLIGLGYTYQLPNTYLNTLVIKPSDNSEFIKYSSFNRLLNSNRTFLTEQSDEKNTINRKILKRFINELEDYEEFVYTLKDTSKVRENFSKVLSEDQKKILFKYSQSLEIIKPKNKNENNFILNLKWDSTDEAIVILQDTISLTLKNFEKLIFKELEDYLEIEKKIALNKDIKRINFLTEQSLIAEELNIKDNQVNIITTGDIAYYLRGYKAINKEIDLIQKRNYKLFSSFYEEINLLKEMDIKWVNYNIYSIKSKSLKQTKYRLAMSIFLGLVIGLLYVLILNFFQSPKVSKKRN